MRTLVYADGADRAALELLTAARSRGGSVAVVGPAEGVRAGADRLGRHGASTIYAVEGTAGAVPGRLVAEAAATVLAVGDVDAVLFPTSCDGRDAAGYLSGSLGRTIVANAIGLEATVDGGLVVATSIDGGTMVVRTALVGPRPWLVSFRPAAFERVEAPVPCPPEIVPLTAGCQAAAVTARHEEPRHGPALEDAEAVVAGGRGVGSAGGFAQVEELARLLGGAPAASRAAVDAGWAPFAIQVGQTGKSVAPVVYIALGLSGAAQHVVGIRGARHVVAVNKDRTAPIFELADLGVVGDVTDLLPRLLDAVRARLADPA